MTLITHICINKMNILGVDKKELSGKVVESECLDEL